MANGFGNILGSFGDLLDRGVDVLTQNVNPYYKEENDDRPLGDDYYVPSRRNNYDRSYERRVEIAEAEIRGEFRARKTDLDRRYNNAAARIDRTARTDREYNIRMRNLNNEYDLEVEKLEREYNREINRARINAGDPGRYNDWDW